MTAKRMIGVLTAAVLCSTALLSFPDQTIAPLRAKAADGRLYNQWDPKWQEYTWDGYAKTGNSMYTSACGIFSFCNAIYALNSIEPDAVEVAQWAYEIKAFRPGGGGTYRDLLYANIEQKFGEKFHFTLGKEYFGTVTQPAAIEHLKSGGVIVLHVPGHFIAVTGYNEQNQTYHVIESAVSDSRGLAPDRPRARGTFCFPIRRRPRAQRSVWKAASTTRAQMRRLTSPSTATRATPLRSASTIWKATVSRQFTHTIMHCPRGSTSKSSFRSAITPAM